MKYLIHYGNGAFAFPEKALEIAPRAGAVDLRVLLALCALRGDGDCCYNETVKLDENSR